MKKHDFEIDREGIVRQVPFNLTSSVIMCNANATTRTSVQLKLWSPPVTTTITAWTAKLNGKTFLKASRSTKLTSMKRSTHKRMIQILGKPSVRNSNQAHQEGGGSSEYNPTRTKNPKSPRKKNANSPHYHPHHHLKNDEMEIYYF